MKWIGQHIYDLVAKFRNTVEFSDTVDFSENVTFYQPVNNADPSIRIGANADECLRIFANYQGSASQSFQQAAFVTHTESGVAGDGGFAFYVDEVGILRFDDDGIDLLENKGISINGTDILTDSSGTATLSNIDAIDATTKATLESALTDSTTDSLVIDTDRSIAQGNAGAEDITALHVDFDRTVPDEGTNAHNDRGIDLDVTSASLGTSSLYGMDIDVVGATSGTSTATGIELTVSGADTNNGMHILCEGEQLRLSHNASDYATFTVADTGDLTIATLGDGSVDSDLILDADGAVEFQPADGRACKVRSQKTSAADAGAIFSLVSDDGASLGDDHRLGALYFQAKESATTVRTGAKIEAYADAAWSTTVNNTRLEFYTMDGDNNSELSLTLDSDLLATFAGSINAAENIIATNTTTSSATEGGRIQVSSNDGAALGDDHRLGKIGFTAAEDGSGTIREGASIEAFADAAWSDTVNDTRLEFYTMDGDNGAELSLTLDSNLLATFAGAVTVTGALTGTLATVSQPNITGVGTIGTGVWQGTAVASAYIADDAVTFAKAVGVTPNVYGTTIKVLPSDFMANEDGGVTKALQFVDQDASGLKPGNAATELLAFVSVPEGMKITLVDVYADSTYAIDVIELDIHQIVTDISAASIGTGNANTQINVTDTNSTATNFFMIQVTTTATSSRVFGALVTIAPQ